MPKLTAVAFPALVACSTPVLGQGAYPGRTAWFRLGDTTTVVARAQKPPAVIEHLTSLGVEIWSWRAATVRFAIQTGRVVEWSDPDHELHAVVEAGGTPTSKQRFGLESSAVDVLRLLGPPIGASLRNPAGAESWNYGSRGRVAIDLARRVVIGWLDPLHRLPVPPEERDAASRVFDASSSPAPVAPAGPSPGAPRLGLAISLADTALSARQAGAANVLILTITNRGQGTAFAVEPYAMIAPATGQTAAVHWGEAIAGIAPGTSATRRIQVRFPTFLLSDRVVLLAGAREQNGHGVVPETRLEVGVVPSRAPRIVLVGLQQDDQSGDGRASPRELVDVLVRLANIGQGTADGASATLSLGRDVFAVAGTPAQLQLPRLAPGDTAEVRFTLYTNARADSTSVAVTVRDARRQLLLAFKVPLRLTGRPAPTPDVAPPPAPADVDAPLEPPAAISPDAIAVIFGIDYYRALPRARFAARDAATMRRYATQAFGVPNDPDHLLVRLDGDATQAEFRRAFGETGWLARRVRPQSDVIVYFAGHGAASPSRAPLLLPFDADANYPNETAVQLADIYAALAKLPARRIIAVVDACFAGVSRDGVPLVDGARPVVLSIEHPALLRDGMAVFAAAQGTQIAGDLPDKQHGLFSYQFFRALRGEADADRNGALTVDEIDDFVRREVKRAASRRDREQLPLTIARERELVVSRRPAPR